MRFYSPKHFVPQEFLPPGLFRDRGESALLVMDARILWTLDALRESFGAPITANNWQTGGAFEQRGFRDDPNTGAPLSQHRFGRACDFDIKGITAEQFREMVRAGKLTTELQYIARIEDGVSWCHIDCASVPGTEILFFHA
jgi:hypothetical protein